MALFPPQTNTVYNQLVHAPMQLVYICTYPQIYISSNLNLSLSKVENMSQEQPVKHVQDTIRELNAQEAASHAQSPTTTPTNPHSNAVASQKEPVGVQVTRSFILNYMLHRSSINTKYIEIIVFVFE